MGHSKSLELTGVRPFGSSHMADNRDEVDLIRACSSTLCYVPNALKWLEFANRKST